MGFKIVLKDKLYISNWNAVYILRFPMVGPKLESSVCIKGYGTLCLIFTSLFFY